MAALIAVGIAMPAADAAKTKEIGKTDRTPRPSCPTPNGNPPPKKLCRVSALVTGFQTTGDGKKGLMRIPKDGTIVGWKIALAKPNKQERKVLSADLNGDPTARLALLSHSEKRKYRLRAQSPNLKLNKLLGGRETITLNDPIPVRKDWIVGLTTASWTPSLAHDLEGPKNSWKASRTKNRCTKRSDLINRSRPHKDVGSTRSYGCKYTDRLLYWAYFLPD